MARQSPSTRHAIDHMVRNVETGHFERSDPRSYPHRAHPVGGNGEIFLRGARRPITWAEHVAAQGHWGRALREYMSDYVHWSCLGGLCEYLPQPGNRVTLSAEKDRHGLPVAEFSYSKCDNDRQLTKAAARHGGDPARGRRGRGDHHRA
ncbi:MAG: hypothetical protein ACRDNF_21265, partial [Streptosporangiaceae bacterium]